jgi:hypothetical protein
MYYILYFALNTVVVKEALKIKLFAYKQYNFITKKLNL